MARDYQRTDYQAVKDAQRERALFTSALATVGSLGVAASPLLGGVDPSWLFALGLVPAMAYANTARILSSQFWLERERQRESSLRNGRQVLGQPPERECFQRALAEAQARGKKMIDKYLVGFELDSGKPLWIDEEDICSHGCVFAKTGVGKTLWLESLIFQQMARGRASGCTFIDAKRDSGTLAHIILMALATGRIEDLIVIDPFDSMHSYNFVLTNQRADVKARKVLRAGLPPTSDQSVTKHYDRLAADSIYRMVRAMESFGLAWSIRDIAVSLSAFNYAYPHIRSMLNKIGARQAMVELGHLASSYRSAKGTLDTVRITDNLRGIASELHAIAGSDMGQVFCTHYTDLVLTDAILRGKIIYFMLPRLEEAESAARMVKVFREDLEVSIGEITSSRMHHLEDPHLIVIDEGSSTFGPTWANLFELARKGRFALLFGAQSAGGLTDESLGLSEAFYERVMANVNLKVMMRVGDNRTAQEMTEWIGKVNTTKKSIGAGVTTGSSSSMLRGAIDLQARASEGASQSVSISEDEEDLVSSEELKHEMSAEKGLAWFDLGDGRIIKGRSSWVNAELPDTWEGREYITHFERTENDEIGLAEWVDEQILSQEERETTIRIPSSAQPKDLGAEPQEKEKDRRENKEASRDKAAESDQSGPFKITLVPRGGKPRGTVTALPKEAAPTQSPEKDGSSSQKTAAKAEAQEKAPTSAKPAGATTGESTSAKAAKKPIDVSAEQKKIADEKLTAESEADRDPFAGL
ncbi:MAG: TraM recognition domain-containing protein [Oligoflexia bacterium]|nr:TraM recognition domain-containing protein [Oligoflexia bacterium]